MNFKEIYGNLNLYKQFILEELKQTKDNILEHPFKTTLLGFLTTGLIGCAAPKATTNNDDELESQKKAVNEEIQALESIEEDYFIPAGNLTSEIDNLKEDIKKNDVISDSLENEKGKLDTLVTKTNDSLNNIESNKITILNRIREFENLYNNVTNSDSERVYTDSLEWYENRDITDSLSIVDLITKLKGDIETYNLRIKGIKEAIDKSSKSDFNLLLKEKEEKLKELNEKYSEYLGRDIESEIEQAKNELKELKQIQNENIVLDNFYNIVNDLNEQYKEKGKLEGILEDIKDEIGSKKTLKDDDLEGISEKLDKFSEGLKKVEGFYGPTSNEIESLVDSLSSLEDIYNKLIDREKSIFELMPEGESKVDLSKYKDISLKMHGILSENGYIFSKNFEKINGKIPEKKIEFRAEKNKAKKLEKRINKANIEFQSLTKKYEDLDSLDTKFYEMLDNIRTPWESRLETLKKNLENYGGGLLEKDLSKDIKAIESLINRIDNIKNTPVQKKEDKKSNFKFPGLKDISYGNDFMISDRELAYMGVLKFGLNGGNIWNHVAFEVGAGVVSIDFEETYRNIVKSNPDNLEKTYSVHNTTHKINGKSPMYGGGITLEDFLWGMDLTVGAMSKANEVPIKRSTKAITYNDETDGVSVHHYGNTQDLKNGKWKNKPTFYGRLEVPLLKKTKIPIVKDIKLNGGIYVQDGQKPAYLTGVTVPIYNRRGSRGK